MRARKHPVAMTTALLALGAIAVRALVACADTQTPAVAAPIEVDASSEPDAAIINPPPPGADASGDCAQGAFCAVPLPTTTPASFNGVWGSAPDDVWIVGSPDVTLHWDGHGLAQAKAGTKQTQFGVWGSSKNDVFTFSAGNAVWHSTGFGDGSAVWTFSDGGLDSWPGAIAAMWGSSSTDIWAVGAYPQLGGPPTVWHSEGWQDGGIAWSPRATSAADPPDFEPISFTAIWGDTTELWIAGLGGKVRVGARTDGGATWKAANSYTTYDLFAVWGDGKGVVVTAGAGGTMRRFTKDAAGAYRAETVALPTSETIYALAGPNEDDLFAAGTGGTLLHRDHDGWKRVELTLADAGDRDLYGMWAAANGDVWLVGRNTLLRRAGAAGSP